MTPAGFLTDRLSVRPWRREDAPWYAGAIDDEILRWTRETGDPTAAQWEQLVEAGSVANATASFCIENQRGEAIGSLAKKAHGDTVELSYWLAAAYRGHGYATEALAGAVDWCGDMHPGAPIVLEIHPGNVASIAVAERAGFMFDGRRASCASCADDNGQVATYLWTA